MYGPITDAYLADQRKIAKLIQRGRAVTDDHLVAQALAYARFRARVCRVLGLIFLVLAAGEAVTAALGSLSPRIVYAVISGGYLLSGIGWLWQANVAGGAHRRQLRHVQAGESSRGGM